MLLDQLEKAFMVIGDKMIMVGGGYKNYDQFDTCDEIVTSELVIKPRVSESDLVIQDRKSLNNMTKKKICDLALELYGFELNFRTEKKLLISQFLELQNK